MKNRLQFDRIPALFASGITYLSGTTMGVSGREKATEALEAYIKRRDFIPLIGEPIVVRYIDDKGKKQAMLAIGKATGSTENDTRGIEYHIIDSAKLQEDIDLANAHAAEALDLASAATHDIANHLIILKNMIGENGIFMEDGSFFDGESDDPSNVGLYKNWSGNPTPYPTTYISGATNMFEADLMLDAAIKEQDIKIEVLSGVTEETIDSLNNLWEAAAALSAATVDFSANTVNEFNEVKSDIEELSAATESFSAGTSTLINNIIEGAGLNNGERGSYAGHDETHIIKDATSLDNADVLLDAALWEVSGNVLELSANTVAALDEVNDKVDELSAATVAIDEKVDELSANTMAADQALQDQIDELSNKKVLGISAITVETLENGDSRVSLLINEEDDKVLTQNTLGLKTSISLVYTRDDKKIYLKGKNDVIISTIDANDFIKDGMLSAASVIVATEEDHEQYPELIVGKTYIKLLFNVDGEVPGRANPVFISAEDLVDVYTVAPESYTYMEISDYVIKLNVDQEGGLASYDYARNISAVTTNIITAAGLNMGGQGTYPGHDETHIIKDATSLDNADVLLDAAIWTVSGMVIELSAASRNYDEIYEAISGLSGNLITYIDNEVANLSARCDEIEEVTAAALNELNDRVGYVETHMTGEYIPLTNYEISSGTSEEELLVTNEDSVNEAFGKIQKQILDNEETTAAGLNNLNDRLTAAEQAIAENSGVTALSAAVMSFSSATYEELSEIHNDITTINSNVTNLSSFTQFLSAHTLGTLTVNLNGTEQGKYCPSASTTLNLTAITEVTGADVLLTGYELSSGSTEEELAVVPTDTVNDAFGKVQKQIYDVEEVVAGALNDLDERVSWLEANSGACEGIEELSASVVTNEYNINVFSAAVVAEEYVIAQAFNDLNKRMRAVSADVQNIEEVMVTGVTVDGVPQPIVDNVAEITLSIPTVNDYFDGAEYNPTAKTLDFYHDTTLKDSVDMSDLGRVYTAGSGISITNNNEIEIKLANKGDNSFIKTDGDGLYLTGISEMLSDLSELSGAVVNNRADINLLSGAIIENEYVIAQAFNDLNRRVVEISGNTGGGGAGGDAPRLDHNVIFNLNGESYGSATTNFDANNSNININTYKKFTTGNSTTNLTFSEFLTIIKVSQSTTLTIASTGLPTLPAGGVKEAHVLIENTGNTAIAITLDTADSRLKFTNGNVVNIEGNGIGEVNALITYNGTNYTIYLITS